jgi:dTDP-4-amino-4,6-dideoxygalactose transaminase
VFVDIEIGSLNLDPTLIEKVITQKTKAILVAHFNGRMADMEAIYAVAKKHSLFVIEDAAQAIGAKYKNNPIGFYGDFACVSFNPMKLLGGYGDGGAVITRQADLGGKISLLRMYGARFEEIGAHHSFVGVSSRLSAFQAAVLSIKIESLDEAIEIARKNYFLYSGLLRGTDGITMLPDPPADYFVNGNRFLLFAPKRDLLIKHLKVHGVAIRPTYRTALPFLDAFASLGYRKGDFPVAEKTAEEIVVLPESTSLSEKEVVRTADLIKLLFKRV